ncbi:MAG: hypothetical protein GY906_40055 [bacterium]|nr:hypothetical protein [bacterium]
MKSRTDGILRSAATGVLVCAVLMAAWPAAAQGQYQLFDKYSFRIEASYVALKTQVRLDSKTLGKGTTLSFEDDLKLGNNTAIPSVAFEWQMGRKHRLTGRWQDISRDSSAQALTEIQWGDEIIPVDASIFLLFDVTQFAVDYTYFPWVEERWAAGFGIGLRVMDVLAELAWQETNFEEGGVQAADVTGPLPYLNFEYRRMFSEKWRFVAGLGWLYVKIGDIEGGQWLADANIEYLLGKRWAFGGGLNLSNIDIDWEGIERNDGENELMAHFDLDINDISFYVRVRF